MKSVFIFLSLFFSAFAYAGDYECAVSESGPYCRYSGQLRKAFVGEDGKIILFPKTHFTDSVRSFISTHFPSVNIWNGAAVSIASNETFAKMLYATGLGALTSGNQIEIIMRGEVGGYIKIDRIWFNEK